MKKKQLNLFSFFVCDEADHYYYTSYSLLGLFQSKVIECPSIYTKIRWQDPFYTKWEGAEQREFLEFLSKKYG